MSGPIRITDIVDKEIEKNECEKLKKLLDYLIAVVRGQRILTRRGRFIYDKVIHDLPYPDNINEVLNRIEDKMKAFRTELRGGVSYD